MSRKKDNLVNIGGWLAVNDEAVFEELRNLVVVYEGLHTYGGMAGRDMEALAIGIEESVQDDHIRARIGQVRYLGELLDASGASRSSSPSAATRSSSTPGASTRTSPQDDFPAQTLAAELYLDSGIRSMERGIVSAGRDPPTGDHNRPKLELTRLTIPRRVYTQAHMDVVAESVKACLRRPRAGPRAADGLRADLPALLPGTVRAARGVRAGMEGTTDMSEVETPAGLDAWVARGAEMAAAEEDERRRMRGMRFDTIAVHGVYSAEAALANQGSIIEPAYLSPAQHFADSDHLEAALGYLMPAWGYTRIANPTVRYLEETLALLESYGTGTTASAVVTGSGMAAVDMAVTPLLADDRRGGPRPSVVVGAKCYGGTFQLFRERFAGERGIDVPMGARAAGHRRVGPAGRWHHAAALRRDAEQPVALRAGHPGGLADRARCGRPARRGRHGRHPGAPAPAGAGRRHRRAFGEQEHRVVGPRHRRGGRRPARHRLPVRRRTISGRTSRLHVKLLPMRDHGPALSPFNALMALTDLRTLRGRMDAWSRSTLRVARFLEAHPAVERVHYPGLASDPGHSVASRDMWLADGADGEGEPANRYGHLLAFTVRGGQPAARRVFDGLRLVRRATDLGRVKSIATIPSISTHQQQGEDGRAIADLPANLVRLSVGGEHPGDVEDDLAAALARA